MAKLWTKIDPLVLERPPVFLEPTDQCYYARERMADVLSSDPRARDGNQPVSNFQKKSDRRGQRDWYYREQAVKQFARELSRILPPKTTAACAPTSKHRKDPEYCDRFDALQDQLRKLRPDLTLVCPFERTKSIPSQKTRASKRNVAKLKQSMKWLGFPEGVSPTRLALIDDVITAGTTFKACQQILNENSPGTELVGVFWARTVWLDSESD